MCLGLMTRIPLMTGIPRSYGVAGLMTSLGIRLPCLRINTQFAGFNIL